MRGRVLLKIHLRLNIAAVSGSLGRNWTRSRVRWSELETGFSIFLLPIW